MDYLFSDLCRYIRDAFWGIKDFKAFSVMILLVMVLSFIVSEKNLADRILVCLLILSLYFIFTGTILIRPVTEAEHTMLTPFWSYRLAMSSFYYRLEILENILLFVPSGILMGLVCRRKEGLWGLLPAIFLMGFSVSIELTQFFLAVGLCEFDDVFNNTLGASAGYFAVRRLYQLIFLSRRARVPENAVSGIDEKMSASV